MTGYRQAFAFRQPNPLKSREPDDLHASATVIAAIWAIDAPIGVSRVLGNTADDAHASPPDPSGLPRWRSPRSDNLSRSLLAM